MDKVLSLAQLSVDHIARLQLEDIVQARVVCLHWA